MNILTNKHSHRGFLMKKKPEKEPSEPESYVTALIYSKKNTGLLSDLASHDYQHCREALDSGDILIIFSPKNKGVTTFVNQLSAQMPEVKVVDTLNNINNLKDAIAFMNMGHKVITSVEASGNLAVLRLLTEAMQVDFINFYFSLSPQSPLPLEPVRIAKNKLDNILFMVDKGLPLDSVQTTFNLSDEEFHRIRDISASPTFREDVRQNEALTLAHGLLRLGMSPRAIQEITGLTEDDLQHITH